MTDLGTLGGTETYPSDINDSGQIVGYSDTAAGAHHGFLYSTGTMIDLNAAVDALPQGWILTSANGINDLGWIAASGTDPGGNSHALILIPIPEPSTLVLVGIGAISLLAYAWRRRV